MFVINLCWAKYWRGGLWERWQSLCVVTVSGYQWEYVGQSKGIEGFRLQKRLEDGQIGERKSGRWTILGH